MSARAQRPGQCNVSSSLVFPRWPERESRVSYRPPLFETIEIAVSRGSSCFQTLSQILLDAYPDIAKHLFLFCETAAQYLVCCLLVSTGRYDIPWQYAAPVSPTRHTQSSNSLTVSSRLLLLSALMSVFSIAAVVPSDDPLAAKAHTYDSQTPGGDLVCRPFGECEPCPADEVRLFDFVKSIKDSCGCTHPDLSTILSSLRQQTSSSLRPPST